MVDMPEKIRVCRNIEGDWQERTRSDLVADRNSVLDAESARLGGGCSHDVVGLKEALAWAIAEIEGRTRYDNDNQFVNAIEAAKGVLANTHALPKINRAPVDDGELQQWADLRADDAGRLARELIGYRRALSGGEANG